MVNGWNFDSHRFSSNVKGFPCPVSLCFCGPAELSYGVGLWLRMTIYIYQQGSFDKEPLNKRTNNLFSLYRFFLIILLCWTEGVENYDFLCVSLTHMGDIGRNKVHVSLCQPLGLIPNGHLEFSYQYESHMFMLMAMDRKLRVRLCGNKGEYYIVSPNRVRWPSWCQFELLKVLREIIEQGCASLSEILFLNIYPVILYVHFLLLSYL